MPGRYIPGRKGNNMKKDREEFERCMAMANEAKDRLADIAERLEEAGYIRKARSCMNLVYLIEAWQNRN